MTVHPDHLLDRLQLASFLNDEPLAHGNDLHILAISECAKPLVTVLLSGDGGVTRPWRGTCAIGRCGIQAGSVRPALGDARLRISGWVGGSASSRGFSAWTLLGRW
jgi:hypothetical protein